MFCARHSFNAVATWARAAGYSGPVAYAFEAGHEHQEDTDELMRLVASVPSLAKEFHYKSHAFVPKEDSSGLQAADFLAWHYCKNHESVIVKGGYSRDDFIDLLGLRTAQPDLRYDAFHNDEEKLKSFAKAINYASARWPLASVPPHERPSKEQPS